MELYFNKVAVIGVGLIGASVALSLREKGLCGTITGCGRKEENLRRARQRNIIDDYLLDAADAAAGADLVVLCTPVGILKDMAAETAPALKRGALVTDVGSIKGLMVGEIEELMPDGVHFVGSHPIAGSEKAGIDDARGSLFVGARCIITPTWRSDRAAVERIVLLWQAIGGSVELMDPFRHDEIFSLVSHMPHVIAYALVNAVESIDPECIKYSGAGFRDTTRIAASSPELWRDICMMNRDNLSKVLKLFRENLDRIEKCMAENDWAAVEREFARAQKLRMSI
ncbi:MAG TPA: prephenate dehydrogenase/arogenate dehydrogenase family protein [Dissulfurispiraceae bacterium]|nr:prephenate dehydrogenase/arogenate dehydrogenase family protein [Dissulfurispiraceae bacterium]